MRVIEQKKLVSPCAECDEPRPCEKALRCEIKWQYVAEVGAPDSPAIDLQGEYPVRGR